MVHAILAPMSVLIPVVLGTGRKERQSEKVAHFAHTTISSKGGVVSEFVDVRDYLSSPFTVPSWEEHSEASKWRKIAQEASGFIFVVPEYNRSFPGEFKLLFDSAFKEYANKPVVLIGVSSGKYGGVRAIQHLLPVLHAASMHVLGTTVATPDVGTFSSGEVDAKYVEFLNTITETLIKNIIK